MQTQLKVNSISCCLFFRGAHDVVSVCSGDSGLSLGWIAHGLQIPVDADPPCYLQYLSGKNIRTQYFVTLHIFLV